VGERAKGRKGEVESGRTGEYDYNLPPATTETIIITEAQPET